MRFVTNALVIHHAPYGEYDRMVTLITPGSGRIDAVARGCRRLKSPLVNVTELFTSGEYTLYQHGGRFSLEQCQISDSFFALRADYDRLVHGIYWLRLLDSFVQPNQPCEEVFLMSLRALAYLNYSDLPAPLLTFAFEAHLMALEGYPPRVDSCVLCGQPLNGEAKFDPVRGGALCVFCGAAERSISYGARRILYRLPRTKFDSVEKLDGHADWREAACLFRAYLQQRVSLPARFYPPLAT